jgi:photosystem II stability/assembly factor-like uncharacterized protein
MRKMLFIFIGIFYVLNINAQIGMPGNTTLINDRLGSKNKLINKLKNDSIDNCKLLNHMGAFYDGSGNIVTTIFKGRIFNNFLNELKSEENSQKAGNVWNEVGPWGGDVNSICMYIDEEDTILYAAAGIPYIKYNTLAPWTVLTSLANYSTNINIIIASNDSIIYACGGSTNALFKSIDKGLTWIKLENVPVNREVSSIAIDPLNSNIIYAGLGCIMGGTNYEHIIKSADGGNSWQLLNTSVLNIEYGIGDISINPNNADQIIVAAFGAFGGGEVIYSDDAGNTWQNITNGLPTQYPFNDIEIAGNTVYISGGQLFGNQYLGVYKCILDDFNWQNISSGFPLKVVNKVIVNPFDTLKIFAATDGDGVYFSNDGGITWDYTSAGADNFSICDILLNPSDPDEIFIGCKSLAVYKSENSGLSWEKYNEGIATLTIKDIAVDPSNNNNVIVAFESWNSGGCFLSNDGGLTWNLVENLPATRFSSVVYDVNGNIYAVSKGPSSVAQEGVYKSKDGGVSWTNTGPNLGPLFETELWVIDAPQTITNPSDSGLLFVGGNHFGVAGHAATIYRTLNGGDSGWEEVYIGNDNVDIHAIEIAPNANNNLIYAGYVSYENITGSLLKSNDKGITWIDINNGVPNNCNRTFAIAADKIHNNIVYAGASSALGSNYILKSENCGDMWYPILNLNSEIYCLQTAYANNSFIYAGTFNNGVIISQDSGDSWFNANDGLPTNIPVSCFSEPFIVDNNLKIYAGTSGRSGFIATIANLDVNDNFYISDFITWNEPNPFSDNTTIHFSLNKKSHVKLSIFNVNGQLITILIDKEMEPCADYQIKWDANNNKHVTKGLYFYRLEIDGKPITKKMLFQ